MTSLGGAQVSAQEVYKADPTHTELRFGWNHSGMSNQSGEFHKVDGTLVLDRDDLTASTISVKIDINSVSTGVPMLDEHLKEPDFFDAASLPEATFESTQITLTGEKTAEVTGDLTIRDVTLPITLSTTLTFDDEHPQGGVFAEYAGHWVAFSATGTIEYPKAFGVGPFPVGEMELVINTELQIQE
ncbi:YceI family protein [Ruegeria sp. ANG-R]|uniref:YceI family protein n=1 Tax=Ruegeria sp. ANG-R TaxID=1577903 RepID=UPI0006898D0F|nr:YceI family protein [Ruegeria sp. ANG-R]